MTDNDKAIQEAERIAATDEYFKARTWLMDTNDNRRIFEAGFDRAYALLSKLRAPVADERAAFEASYRSRFNVPADTGLTFPDVAEAWKWWQRRAALASAPVAGEADEDLAPPDCPITRRPLFMAIEHPELGMVPTYGGPFDSYTIPYMDGEAHQPWHERELFVRRYDHDLGGWRDDESIPLRVVHEDVLHELQDAASQASEAVRWVVTDDMRAAVRFAPSSAHWSERLKEFFGPDAREGINALEKQLREARANLDRQQRASETVRDALMAFDEAMSLCDDYPELQHHRDALLFAVQRARAALSAQPGAQRTGGSDA